MDTGRPSKCSVINWMFNKFPVVKGQNSFGATLVAGLLVADSGHRVRLVGVYCILRVR